MFLYFSKVRVSKSHLSLVWVLRNVQISTKMTIKAKNDWQTTFLLTDVVFYVHMINFNLHHLRLRPHSGWVLLFWQLISCCGNQTCDVSSTGRHSHHQKPPWYTSECNSRSWSQTEAFIIANTVPISHAASPNKEQRRVLIGSAALFRLDNKLPATS